MSSEKTQSINLPPKIKDLIFIAGWIAGLLLIAGLVWYFTQSVRSNLLLRAVNKVMEQSGDNRRLGERLPVRSAGMGSWFSITEAVRRRDSGSEVVVEGTRAYVFVFISNGSFFPCAAVVLPEGRVEEYIPLNSQGRRMLKRVSPEILSIYSSRIEGLEL